MAKQNVSILERHIEKAVVGLTGLILLGAVVMYGIMQPNTQQAGSETVSPTTIDERVTEAAEKVKRAITTANPEAKPIESAKPRLEQYRDVLAAGGLLGRMPGIVAWQPPVPDVGRIVPQEGEILLAQGIKPTKPVVTSGRSTLGLYPPVDLGQEPGSSLNDEEEEGYRQPVGWVTASVTFDFNAQQLAFKRAGYGKGFETPYLVGLEVQRREQRYDGGWSDDDWATIQQTRLFRTPEPPVITLEQQEGRKVATAASRDAAQRYLQEITDPEFQVELMRPLFPLPLNGNGWKPVTIPGIDLTRIDNELLATEATPGGKVAIRDYTPWDIERLQKVVKAEDRIKELKQQMAAAEKARDWAKALEHAQSLIEITEIKESDRKEVEKKIDEFSLEIEKLAIANQSTPTNRQGQPPPPPQVKSKRSDLQLVWAHDANISSLHGGHTYQYRLRVKLHNNYYANPGHLKNPDDATKPYVLGEWSDPSEPITIPPNSMFFVARGDPEKQQVRVSSYQWAYGVWVDSNFEISPGERIGGIAPRPVPFQEKPKAIMFNSGATALDIDFDRLMLEERNPGKGDFENKPAPTVALVYLDEQGNVRERLALLDKQSPEQKAVKDTVFDEKAAAKLQQQNPEQSKKDEETEGQGGGKSGGGRGKRGGGGGRRG